MVVYNLTNVTNANNILDVTIALNETIGGAMGILSLLVVFLIIFIATKNNDTKSSFLASSFVTSIIGMGMLFTGFIGFNIAIYPMVLFFASLLIYMWWR